MELNMEPFIKDTNRNIQHEISKCKFYIKECKAQLSYLMMYELDKNQLEYKKAFQKIHKCWSEIECLKDELRGLRKELRNKGE